MSSSHFGSNHASSGFHELHRGLQAWIWRKGWTKLRDVQEDAIPPILAGRDALLSAPTAGGKTEAAFLPIASVLASSEANGIGCLCISPLKALINDQYERLQSLFEAVDVPVFSWHGDVPQSRKKKALEASSGLLIITPESLEAIFVRRGAKTRALWRGLRYLVVDELHAFIGSERGRQLQSLLHRVERARGERIARIGLSATLGDMNLAAEFLRPGNGDKVVQIEDKNEDVEIQIQLRGYIQRPPLLGPKQIEQAQKEGKAVEPEQVIHGGTLEIAEHLFKVLRGDKHLVFANSRRRVEELSDILRRHCERNRVPNEFFPHHGSLNKELREEAETILKSQGRPSALIATTTLELGIDVGEIRTVAQVGVPPSVAALRQRLGRSGRSGKHPAVLRLYLAEGELTPKTPVQDALRAQLFQTVAMLELLLFEDFCEPPDPHQLHLSTLIQQLLSSIAERGGIRAKSAYELLCASGPFNNVSPNEFALLLRSLADEELIAQADDEDLVLGLAGEKLVDHYEFYAAFYSPEEYRLVAGDRTLGSLPIVTPVFEGMLLIFAGRRWKVIRIELEEKLLLLAPSTGGVPPTFDGSSFSVHDRIRSRMRALYESEHVPSYLNRGSERLLREGRETYEQLELVNRSLLSQGSTIYLFPWAGSQISNTLVVWLAHRGFEVGDQGVLLSIENAETKDVIRALDELANSESLQADDLAERVRNLEQEKYDCFLPEPLARANYARRFLNVEGAKKAARMIVDRS